MSLTSPTLAQAPATTPELETQPTQPWQSGQPVEFRQPRPFAFDKASSGNSALAKHGNTNVGQELSRNAEEQVLLRLLLEEKRLLADYGSEHPDVLSIRERIQIVREYLAQHPPVPPPTIPAPPPPIPTQAPSILEPPPPIPVRTPHREAPSTTASKNSSGGQPPHLLFSPVRSQILKSGGTKGDTEAKDRNGNTQTVTSRGRPERIRPASFSTAGDPIRDQGTAPISQANPSPTAVGTNAQNTHPAASASPNPSAQAMVSPSSSVRDTSASQPSEAQPRESSFFQTGWGQLICIVGAVFLGVLIQLIAFVFLLRRSGPHLAQVFRVELVNPPAVNLVGQVSAAGVPTVVASPVTQEITQISTSEEVTPSSTAEEESNTAEIFDIGPTYEEDLRQKQEALAQQEQAVLLQIFEQNLQIREELSQLSGGAA